MNTYGELSVLSLIIQIITPIVTIEIFIKHFVNVLDYFVKFHALNCN